MDKKIYEMTLKQYQDSMVREGAKMGKVSIKEARQYYPLHSLSARHAEACFMAAKHGIALRRVVLDSLNTIHRHRIFHDIPDYQALLLKNTGKIYINPEARETYRKGIL